MTDDERKEMANEIKTQVTGALPEAFAKRSLCYLTTIGRVSGNLHEIEIWFAVRNDKVYILSGGRDRSDWVKNIAKTPGIRIRFDDQTFTGVGRIVAPDEPEDRVAREALMTKYYGWHEGQPLNSWATESLPVAIRLD
jgi:deazaflavin-dependent oxidoreductase (nitroreductase family)